MYVNVTAETARKLAADLIAAADAIDASDKEGAYFYTRAHVTALSDQFTLSICVRKTTD